MAGHYPWWSISHGRHRPTPEAAQDSSPDTSGLANARTAANRAISWAVAQNFASFNTGGAARLIAPLPKELIKAGEVIAYRCWRLKGDYLHSMAIDKYRWEPGGIATLLTPEQSVEMCTALSLCEKDVDLTDFGAAGLHGYKAEDEACQYGFDWVEGIYHLCGAPEEIVFGTVALWGDLIEHERGYRAEFAAVNSIDSLYSRSTWRSLKSASVLRELRARYLPRVSNDC